jgi:hypothetical protein
MAGVRLPDAELPLGRLEPPAIPPVSTSGITAICGNFGGYQPFTAGQLADRYGSVDRYEQDVRRLLDRLVRRGYPLAADRDTVVDDLRSRYRAAR